MLLARTVVRMMGRRLALRKGLAVSAAVLLLLGWGVLYLSLSRGRSSGVADNSPTLPTTQTQTSATPRLSSNRPAADNKSPLNMSVFPAHLRTPPPVAPNPSQRGSWGNRSTVHLEECRFTEVTEVTGVDVQVGCVLGDNSCLTM